MTWLITGGAGYIGAHVAAAMSGAGEQVAVYDDLSSGAAGRVPGGVPLVTGTVLDRSALDSALREHAVTGVVHLAARKEVGESVEQPLRYYRENVEGLRTLLAAVVDAGIGRFVFSSSAAVYGLPDVDLVTEDTPCAPVNPYGETKLAGEWLVRSAGRAHGIGTVSLRYFNVAGAARPGLGDPGASNLVPMVFQRLTDGAAPVVFGGDYPTPDGSCVRDFVDVRDIASAHLAAARRLAGKDPAGDAGTSAGRPDGGATRPGPGARAGREHAAGGTGPAAGPGGGPRDRAGTQAGTEHGTGRGTGAGPGSGRGTAPGPLPANDGGKSTADRTELTVNIGRGEGVSVHDMIRRITAVTGHPDVRPVVAARRPGDPARVVASAGLARGELGWTAHYSVMDMITSAWDAWRAHHGPARR